MAIDGLIDAALADPGRRLAFVVPPGVSWPLPIYELALMTRRRADESGRRELAIGVYSPESTPLTLFGSVASDAVAELLAARRIEVRDALVHEGEAGELVISPGRRRVLEAGAVVALPLIGGPAIEGLPRDERGFIPIDEHARVAGSSGVYAAGDGTNFPIKQGGIGNPAGRRRSGADRRSASAPRSSRGPFTRCSAGQLITGGESLHLRHELAGGHGEGEASPRLPVVATAQGQRPLSGALARRASAAAAIPSRPRAPLEVEIPLSTSGTPSRWRSIPTAPRARSIDQGGQEARAVDCRSAVDPPRICGSIPRSPGDPPTIAPAREGYPGYGSTGSTATSATVSAASAVAITAFARHHWQIASITNSST